MTAEQLEELLEDAYTPGYRNRFRELQNMAPYLARKVIAAEKLVEALTALSDHFNNGAEWSGESRSETISKVEQFAKRALTAHREASK